MVRNEPLDHPSPETAARAADEALDRPVAGAESIEEGLNAVYRIDLADGDRAVLKAATVSTDAEIRPEPAVLRRIGRQTDVPVPAVLADVPPGAGPIDAAYFLQEFCDGREVTDVLALSPAARERLVREAGHNLAALHEVPVPVGFGDVGYEDGELVLADGHAAWEDRFADQVETLREHLTGERAEYHRNDGSRFSGLAAPGRAAFETFPGALADAREDVTPSILHGDYRPANLVFAPADDADPLTRAVLDFGAPTTGDGLLDLAYAEDALVVVPLGGTDEGEQLARAIREAYAGRRAGTLDPGSDPRYPHYRLFARYCRLLSFDYWTQFAREDDEDAVEERFRSFVRDLAAEVA